jgi:Nif-specific regulatory protein
MDSLKAKVSEIEKGEITKALMESNWIMARAARLLGITERMIGYKIRKYGIRRGGDGLTAAVDGLDKRVYSNH